MTDDALQTPPQTIVVDEVFRSMSGGWTQVVPRIRTLTGEQPAAAPRKCEEPLDRRSKSHAP